MIYWSKEIDEILSCGLPLNDYGVNNWALSREDVFKVLDIFLKRKISILGGDVYRIVKGELEITYDNWYFDKFLYESKDSYLIRSINETYNYINQYKIKKDVYFAIVPDI
ncbi:MAG: hypothetical protein JXK07_01050 [Spirochaetes bacterium]|nr:hypothetical protein [Spirochaetota bacterium]MBN2769852.1 hypothetical protein [Spirochaetota bacterium]